MAKQADGGPKGNVAARVDVLVRPVVEGMGLRLWDVRFDKEGPDHFLRVFIDRDTPLDTDTCEQVSRAIDPILDEADPISESYYLEVGSPGLGRRLAKPGHFAAMQGREARVKLYKPDDTGQKELTGLLAEADETGFALDTGAGRKTFSYKEAAQVKLCDDENLFGE